VESDAVPCQERAGGRSCVETAVPARVCYLSVPCLRVGGERGGDGGGPRSRNGFGSPQRSHAEGEGRDKALQAAGAVQRYRLVERVMQGRPSVVVAPLVPPAARGEAIMPPGGACSSAPDCDSRTAIHRQRPLRRCASRLRRPCYALDLSYIAYRPDDRGFRHSRRQHLPRCLSAGFRWLSEQ
jgi:hypothetical protein